MCPLSLSKVSCTLSLPPDSFRLPASGRLSFPLTGQVHRFEIRKVWAPQRAILLTNYSCVAVDALSHVAMGACFIHEAAILNTTMELSSLPSSFHAH